MKIINAGVTAPKGFKCAGLRAGVKSGKTNKDMAMIVSEVPAKIAGTFTKNIVKAAPVLWGKKIVEEQEAVRAVVINTGIANKKAGLGQIGAGTVHPPIECFEKAIAAYAQKLGMEGQL